MIQSKGEIERHARLTLGAVCNYPIEYLACADKPDLQDAIHSYGIEVVEDCYERLICAYQEAREINDELEELLKNTFARYAAITALPKRLRHSM